MITRSTPSLRSVLVLFAMLAVGFAWLGWAERSLWLQAPADSLDRYLADRLLPELPERVDEEALWQLCAERPLLARVWAPRTALAQCLGGGYPKASGERLVQLRAEWVAAIKAQIAFAHKVEAISLVQALPELQRLRELHRRLQRESGGPILRTLERAGLAFTKPTLAHPVPDAEAREAGRVATLFIPSRAYTERRLADALSLAPAADQEGLWLSLRNLGLLAAGRLLEYDSARADPLPFMTDDRASLASRLEWARRAKPRAGTVLDSVLSNFMPMMTISAAVGATIALLFGASPLIAAVLFMLAALGGLLIMDIAFTGPIALRHIPARDFVEGGWNLWGTAHGMLWGPAVVFALCLAGSATLVRSRWGIALTDRVLRWPLRAWGILLLGTFAVAMLAQIGAAARTDCLVLVAAAASSLMIARYAPLLSSGVSAGAIVLYAAPLILAGLCASLLGNLAQSDFGALGVSALVLLVAAAIMLRNLLARAALVVFLAFGLTAYAQFVSTGQDKYGVIEKLPERVRDRLWTVSAPLERGAPDVSQVKWLIRSAERPGIQGTGWGWGNVPWTGFPGSRSAALPLPAVSDLAVVLPAAVGGLRFAIVVVAALSLLLIVLVHRGLSRAFGAEVRIGERFLASLGAFGLLTALLRVIASAGGSLGVIPLTGVPVVLIAHAPVATLFALGFAGVVLGTCAGRDES